MRKRQENLSEDQLAERFAEGVVEAWLSNLRRVRHYIEPTVQLLAKEGYQAASVLIPGCHLVALSPEHLLIGYVSMREWPAPPEVEIFQIVPAPIGTKRVLFRWHGLMGIPDRQEI